MRRFRATPPIHVLFLGAAAGAAGTTALNAATYVDMAVRGRASSSTPEDTVEKLAETVHLSIPGEDEKRENRKAGLGPLMGIAAGVGVGAGLGLVRAWGWRPPTSLAVASAVFGAMIAGNGPMMALGITSPRDWSAIDWLSDLLPHAAYGVVTTYVLDGLM
jgi:hypothetical protein